MQVRTAQIIGVSIFLVAALPLWARTDKQTLTLDQPATMGTEQLKPGAYQIKADEGQNQITVQDEEGKVVAQVSGHWVQLPKKAPQSEVNMNGRTVTEVQFSGRTEAFDVQPKG